MPLLSAVQGRKIYYIEFFPSPAEKPSSPPSRSFSGSCTPAPHTLGNSGPASDIDSRLSGASIPRRSSAPQSSVQSLPGSQLPTPVVLPRTARLEDGLSSEVCFVLHWYQMWCLNADGGKKPEQQAEVDETAKTQETDPGPYEDTVCPQTRRHSEMGAAAPATLCHAVIVDPHLLPSLDRSAKRPFSTSIRASSAPFLNRPNSSQRQPRRAQPAAKMVTISLLGDRAEVIAWLRTRWQLLAPTEQLVSAWVKRAMMVHAIGWDGEIMWSYDNEPRNDFHDPKGGKSFTIFRDPENREVAKEK